MFKLLYIYIRYNIWIVYIYTCVVDMFYRVKCVLETWTSDSIEIFILFDTLAKKEFVFIFLAYTFSTYLFRDIGIQALYSFVKKSINFFRQSWKVYSTYLYIYIQKKAKNNVCGQPTFCVFIRFNYIIFNL